MDGGFILVGDRQQARPIPLDGDTGRLRHLVVPDGIGERKELERGAAGVEPRAVERHGRGGRFRKHRIRNTAPGRGRGRCRCGTVIRPACREGCRERGMRENVEGAMCHGGLPLEVWMLRAYGRPANSAISGAPLQGQAAGDSCCRAAGFLIYLSPATPPDTWARRWSRVRRFLSTMWVYMTIKRLDHISVVVEDLDAAIAFFTALGLSVVGRGRIEGPWVDRINAIEGIQVDIVMMRTPDGHGQLELTKFFSPELVELTPAVAPPNALGLRSVMFTVEDVDDTVDRLRAIGGELIGEIVQY